MITPYIFQNWQTQCGINCEVLFSLLEKLVKRPGFGVKLCEYLYFQCVPSRAFTHENPILGFKTGKVHFIQHSNGNIGCGDSNIKRLKYKRITYFFIKYFQNAKRLEFKNVSWKFCFTTSLKYFLFEVNTKEYLKIKYKYFYV